MRDFGIEAVPTQARTGLGRETWHNAVAMGQQPAPRSHEWRRLLCPPRTRKQRRRGGVIRAADAAQPTTHLNEPGAGRPRAQHADAYRARSPMPAHMRSAAQLPAACLCLLCQICCLEGRRYTLGTGPGSRFWSTCTTRNESRDSHVPIWVHHLY